MRVPWQRIDADGVGIEGSGEWRRVLVYGLGLSGRAAAEWLRGRGVEVVAVDRRPPGEVPLGPLADDPGVRLLAGREPDALPDDLSWNDLHGVVLSPGVPTDRPLLRAARAAGVPVIAEVEMAFPWLGGPVVAITGSNGKSTTTAMTGAMLHAAGLDAEVCGNIGEPLSSKIPLAPRAEPRTFVVELSSFQLESIDRFHPKSAALLNLAADHLDRHQTFEAYRDAKLEIFRRQTPDDVAVLNGDDPEVTESTRDLAARKRYFSRRGRVLDGCAVDGARVVEHTPNMDPTVLFELSDVSLPGPHNLENAMAAALLARSRGVSAVDVVRGLRTFRGLPHRLELVRELDGVLWYDDSKGTNLAATLMSLEGFRDGQVLLILGGIFKGGDLGDLARLVARKARIAYLIGESAELFEKHLVSTPGMTTRLRRSETLDQAVEEAVREARPGEVVLLSPACSSFDQFANFAERGRIFQQMVRDLPEGVSHGS